MRRRVRALRVWLLVPLLVLLIATPVSAIGFTPGLDLKLDSPILKPTLQLQPINPPIPIAFSVMPNRYTNLDPATVIDVNGDLVGDIQIGATTVIGKNGAQIQLLDPPVLSLDQVQIVPAAGYGNTAPLQRNRVYVAKLTNGGYAKFLLLQTTPKLTIWFHYGTETTSTLTANGSGGHAVLTWDELPDAALGYNIYRYEMLESNAYTVTLLNDFTIQDTTFTDNTADNHYYLYVVMAIKANGGFGSSTTVAAVQVQSLQRNILVSLPDGTAKLDGTNIPLDAVPVIKNGRLMIPVGLMTNAGVKVTFDTSTSHLTLTRRIGSVTYTVEMTIDTPEYTWNTSEYKADVPPYLAGGVVMVPVRVVAPSLGFGLSFNSQDRTATIQWYE